MLKHKRDAKQRLHVTKRHKPDNETGVEYVLVIPTKITETTCWSDVIIALAIVIILDTNGAGTIAPSNFWNFKGRFL